jgi:signal transduction histidine kinase
MRLSKFIMTNLEEIVTEWESFVRTMMPEKQLDSAALRDDAGQILSSIAQDMETLQTASQQTKKSQGLGPKTDMLAERHTLIRLGQGFDQVQVISEFRALRATVIRLWLNSSSEINDTAMLELIRFNEGIDQVLSQSAARFMEKIEESTNFAVAVMAHDLRNPLHAILSAAELLQFIQPIDVATLGKIATTMINSGTQMSRLINNLLDFTRTRLGQTLPVNRLEIDVAPVCHRVVAELATAYPDRTIELSCSECLRGSFDETRIGEMLSNLIANAIQHGHPATPITVTVSLEVDHMIFQVHNEGTPIPESALPTIFDVIPLRKKEHKMSQSELGHLGIGLFIVKKIVEAHSGTISASSTAVAGTTFVVSLPCHENEEG